MALAALAALSTVASTAQAKTSHRHSSVVRSAPHHGKKATKGADPNPYAGWTQFARGYFTQGNNVPTFGNSEYAPGNVPYQGLADYARGYQASHPAS